MDFQNSSLKLNTNECMLSFNDSIKNIFLIMYYDNIKFGFIFKDESCSNLIDFLSKTLQTSETIEINSFLKLIEELELRYTCSRPSSMQFEININKMSLS